VQRENKFESKTSFEFQIEIHRTLEEEEEEEEEEEDGDEDDDEEEEEGGGGGGGGGRRRRRREEEEALNKGITLRSLVLLPFCHIMFFFVVPKLL
jgi:hypothetical protein